MSIAIKKKPSFDSAIRDVPESPKSFSINLSKLSLQHREIIESIILEIIKINYSSAQRASAIRLNPAKNHLDYSSVSLNGYFSVTRKETDEEYVERQKKYEKDVASYNNWLKKNKEKIQKQLDKRHRELNQIKQDIDEMVLIEQYTV